MSSSFETFHKLEAAMRGLVLERDKEIRGILLGLACREHVFQIGPPGSGKSYTAWCMGKLVADCVTFTQDYNPFSLPEDTRGEKDYDAAINHGRSIFNWKGGIQSADFASLDEIFKANGAVLAVLTSILCDGVFKEEGIAKVIRLKQAIASSNELPPDELAYLWDRFMMRYCVSDIQSDANRLRAMELEELRRRSQTATIAPVCSMTGLEAAIEDFRNGPPIGKALRDGMMDVERACNRGGVSISTRRRSRLQFIVHADMTIFNASLEDALLHMADGMWEKPEEFDRIMGIVATAANPSLGEVQKARHAAVDASRKLEESIAKFTQRWEAASGAERSTIRGEARQEVAQAVGIVETVMEKVKAHQGKGGRIGTLMSETVAAYEKACNLEAFVDNGFKRRERRSEAA